MEMEYRDTGRRGKVITFFYGTDAKLDSIKDAGGRVSRVVEESESSTVGGEGLNQYVREEMMRDTATKMNDTPVVGLWEGGTLCVEGGRITLAGAPARVFRKGSAPVDVEAGADLAGLLAS